MLLDIQGSRYSLYDPEIATADLIDEGEVFFCCGICLLKVLTGSIMTTYAKSIVTSQVKSQAGSRRDPANPTWDPGWD